MGYCGNCLGDATVGYCANCPGDLSVGYCGNCLGGANVGYCIVLVMIPTWAVVVIVLVIPSEPDNQVRFAGPSVKVGEGGEEGLCVRSSV